MKGTILAKIVEAKRRRVQELKSAQDLKTFYDRARSAAADRPSHRMLDVISVTSRTNIIAEFKRASPSKGIINQGLHPADAAIAYRNGGAAAISVLTEEDFFRGSLDDLREVRQAVDLPNLRKDFIVDDFQIYESALAGAEAVLLIAAALSTDQLRTFLDLATSVNLDAIIEVHNGDEMSVAIDIGAAIIGVNNRDLKSFAVSLDISRDLIDRKPEGTIMIAESGITTADEISELRDLGYSAFLVGETLMRSGDPEMALRELVGSSTDDSLPAAPFAAEGMS